MYAPSYLTRAKAVGTVRERVALFIDGSNLYNGMRENVQNTRVNLQELMRQLVNASTASSSRSGASPT